jgi:hypothetical protein
MWIILWHTECNTRPDLQKMKNFYQFMYLSTLISNLFFFWLWFSITLETKSNVSFLIWIRPSHERLLPDQRSGLWCNGSPLSRLLPLRLLLPQSIQCWRKSKISASKYGYWLAPSAVQPPQTAQALCCRIRNAQIKLGICMIMMANSAARRASLGTLLLPAVMDVHRQVMRFEVAKHCWTLWALDKVSSCFETLLNITR